MWNNARHAQYIPVRFSGTTPVFLLGKDYDLRSNTHAPGRAHGPVRRPTHLAPGPTAASPVAVAEEEPIDDRALMADIRSRPWLTYRQGFEPIGGSQYTTDVGWGCMIRSGQMLLATALIHHVLGRGMYREGGGVGGEGGVGCPSHWLAISSEWRISEHGSLHDITHRQVLQLFDDRLAPHCPFSVHNLLRLAGSRGSVKPGDWLGPTTVCRALW